MNAIASVVTMTNRRRISAEGKRWYAVFCKPRAEWLAQRELRKAGYDTLYLHERGTVTHARKTIGVLKPYFARYLFLGAEPWQGLYAANNAMGVSTVVYSGGEPLEVPISVIEELRSRGDANGLVKTEDVKLGRRRFQQGETVRITAGPLQGLFAELALDDGEQVRVWLQMFGGKVEAVLDPTGLEPASPDRWHIDPITTRLTRHRKTGNGA